MAATARASSPGPTTTALERTLAKALTEIVIGLDLSDDDAITPEAATAVPEPVIALLQDLPELNRRASSG
ncbi:hypothetical protein AB0L53_40000 [Nonomuraea sp. NPDC052129]|uniref:hypothetical protein n=1 Tax=Nonomuraea sp. NPDC052129 TaxID=3154651 RepID=UPI00341B91A2